MYGDMLDMLGASDDGWDGDDATITCPCGHTIEPDADACADGCKNPIMEAGMI